jgi:hypothetical protein
MKKYSLVARLAIATAAVAMLAACSTGGSGGGDGGGGGASDTDAWIACKDAVEAQLDNPATADFALMQSTIEADFIDGILTAENNFGVKQELQFHCERSGSAITDVEVLPTS